MVRRELEVQSDIRTGLDFHPPFEKLISQNPHSIDRNIFHASANLFPSPMQGNISGVFWLNPLMLAFFPFDIDISEAREDEHAFANIQALQSRHHRLGK